MLWFSVVVGFLLTAFCIVPILPLDSVKESLLLRRARRQARSCRRFVTFAQISAACTCLRNVRYVLDESDFYASNNIGRVRLYQSLGQEVAALEVRFNLATATPVFREQCLDTLLRAASGYSLDVSVQDVVVFEIQCVDEVDDASIRLYIPFVTVAEQLPYTVISAPAWFYQLVLRVVDEQPDRQPGEVKLGLRPKSLFPPKVFPCTFDVSADILAAALSLWNPRASDDLYCHFSDAVVAAKQLVQ